MAVFRCFYSILFLHVSLTLAMVHAQNDQSGFISIDCGISQGSNYTDTITGINYVSDAGFIESGVSQDISPEYNIGISSQLRTLRSFPENVRNCYTLRPKQGKNNKYLIRVLFLYGNYDSLGQSLQFDLYLRAALWSTVYIRDRSGEYYNEIIHLVSSDYINVCLVNTGQGNPFISAIELRLLNITMYDSQLLPLDVFTRTSFGSKEPFRYADDKYDRMWNAQSLPGGKVIQTSNIVSSGTFQVPSKVMSTAITPIIPTDTISYTWNGSNNNMYLIYLHLVEVEILKKNESREFNIYLNGNRYGPFSPSPSPKIATIRRTAPFTGFSSYTININKTINSTRPPIINAIEIYIAKQFKQQKTDDQDVDTIWKIKSTYGLQRSWQGDPCAPQEFVWDGVNCSYKDSAVARIISLNLSSSGLSGEIATALTNLTAIESLDLSYNNLTGTVPEFLARLNYLRILNLTGNNFARLLPAELLEKSKKGSLLLSIETISAEDASSCIEGSCRNSKHNKGATAAIATLGTLVFLLTILATILIINRRKTKDLIIRQESFKSKNQRFTFSEVQRITENFKTRIGKGGFGTVYRGHNGSSQVAVKMLSESSAQGYKEFQSEVKLLMNVHHRNITSLVGYCNDNGHKGIIYEFMANGNLEEQLFNRTPEAMSWERRLQIGCDTAEGLAYMHHGCTPPIVHRDVKSSNILLNEHFQARIADFGLSRAFKTEDASHVSSEKIAGTYGYLDPEYHATNRLTEKSDVYSFGVVLLELITNRRAISEDINIINWVKTMYAEGDVENIIVRRLKGDFSVHIAMKVVEVAKECVSQKSKERPAMNDVAVDLKQCLQAQKTRNGTKSKNLTGTKSINKRGYESLNLECMSNP